MVLNFLGESNSELADKDLRVIADLLPSPIFYCDSFLVYRYANPAGARLYGRSVEDIVGKGIDEVLETERVRLYKTRHDRVLAGETLRFEESRKFGDETTRRVQAEYIPHQIDNGSVAGFFVLLTDVTERYMAEMEARDAAEQLRMISDAVPAQISFVDRDRRVVMVNSTAAEWFARDPKDIVGRKISDLLGTEFAHKTDKTVNRVLNGERVEYQSQYTFPDGVSRALETTYIPNVRADSSIDGYFVLSYDVTDFKRVEDDLRLLATTDSLTGVFNRRRILEICDEEIIRARRYDRHLSVVMCDIDHFKAVNDIHGHDAGDGLIKRFAELAGKTVREGIDAVGRLGGDEFVLVLPETSISNARVVAERLRRAWERETLETEQGVVRLSCCLGVAELSVRHQTERDILKQADRALYLAKESGRNRVCVDVTAAESSVRVATRA